MDIKEYHDVLQKETDKVYDIAETARKKGLDAEEHVEVKRTKDIAARVEGLVGPAGVAKRIRELLAEKSRNAVSLDIVREIMGGNFGKIEEKNELAEQCIRTALTLLTEGVVAASIEGITKVRTGKNSDGSEYLIV